MRYVFLTIGHVSGAVYTRARLLGSALMDRGVSVGYVVDDYPENRENSGIDPRAEIAWVAHPRSVRQLLERRRAVRQLRPDYVELLGARTKIMAAVAGMRGIRIVGVWDEPETLKDYGLIWMTGLRFLDFWLRRWASVRITCSRELQRLYRDRFDMDSLYMPHAIYLPDVPDGPSPFAAPTVVYMGNLFPLWDQDLLFDAFALLAKRGEKPPIYLMGGGTDTEKWKAFSREHGLDNVTFGGFVPVDELCRRLRHAHVLLFPIRPTLINKTRCPSKTFAYAQSGRPVITSRVGEVAEILGEKATYIDPTPEAMADAITAAVASPRPPDVDYGTEAHTWPRRADQLLAHLNQK